MREPDYAYGQGVLYLRIESVDRTDPVYLDGESRLWVEGIQGTSGSVEMRRRRVLVGGCWLLPRELR